jgi:serine/threonine protein kinase
LSTLFSGKRVGPYEVVAPLGAGGMGEIWRATDTRLGREVAIKALPETLALDPERRARFEREARLLAALKHPNVATIYGFEDADGAPHIVLELVEGESLEQRLERGPIATRAAVAILL